MDRINYHHLHYFWVVVREGSIAGACRRMGVAQPTVSEQLRQLELALGVRLFERSGRTLVLTETGTTVFRYADEIFTIGRELLDVVRGRPVGAPLRFRVGVADVLSKLVVYRMLVRAMDPAEPVRLVCHEGKPVELLARLSVHELDVVLADTPVPPNVSVRAYSHRLGESGVTVFARRADAARYRRGFPRSLDGAPMLLPAPGSVVRRQLDGWLEQEGLRPRIAGEFEDSALLKVFGQSGAGLFVGPSVIERDIESQYGARAVGRARGVKESFYAISMERRIKHPAVVRLTDAARERLAGGGGATG